VSETKHRTRLEVIRNNVVVNVVEPNMEGSTDDFKISTTSSINSFPTLSLKSANSEINQVFMDFSKRDIVRLSISSTPSNSYITMFEGEFKQKSIKFEAEPKTLDIELQAIHSFFSLSTLELSSIQQFKGTKFEEFVTILVEMAGINSKVSIANELSQIPITGLSRHTNAFRLFKEVCLIINAAVTFNSDNTVNIEYRPEKLNNIRDREVKTITEKEIISSDSTYTI